MGIYIKVENKYNSVSCETFRKGDNYGKQKTGAEILFIR